MGVLKKRGRILNLWVSDAVFHEHQPEASARRLSRRPKTQQTPSLTLFEVAHFVRSGSPAHRQPVARATGVQKIQRVRPEGPTQSPVCRPFRPRVLDTRIPVAYATGIGYVDPPGLKCATSISVHRIDALSAHRKTSPSRAEQTLLTPIVRIKGGHPTSGSCDPRHSRRDSRPEATGFPIG